MFQNLQASELFYEEWAGYAPQDWMSETECKQNCVYDKNVIGQLQNNLRLDFPCK